MVDELTVDQVRKTCDPQSLGFETTSEIDPREGIIGQARGYIFASLRLASR